MRPQLALRPDRAAARVVQVHHAHQPRSCRRRDAPVEQADIDPASDGRSDVARLLGLVDGPVAALGLSVSAAAALEQALEVRTVRDLAGNKYVRRAQVIVKLTNETRAR